jgi:hypothetical protein
MPPSQKGTLFKRKDIAKAVFDLDISDSEPSTAGKTPKPRDGNRLIASKPPLDEAKGDNKVVLLTLPIEIRLQIYGLLVVSRFNRTENSCLSPAHYSLPESTLIPCYSPSDSPLYLTNPNIPF